MDAVLEFLQSINLREVIAAGVGVFIGLLLAHALRSRRK